MNSGRSAPYLQLDCDLLYEATTRFSRVFLTYTPGRWDQNLPKDMVLLRVVLVYILLLL